MLGKYSFVLILYAAHFPALWSLSLVQSLPSILMETPIATSSWWIFLVLLYLVVFPSLALLGPLSSSLFFTWDSLTGTHPIFCSAIGWISPLLPIRSDGKQFLDIIETGQGMLQISWQCQHPECKQIPGTDSNQYLNAQCTKHPQNLDKNFGFIWICWYFVDGLVVSLIQRKVCLLKAAAFVLLRRIS